MKKHITKIALISLAASVGVAVGPVSSTFVNENIQTASAVDGTLAPGWTIAGTIIGACSFLLSLGFGAASACDADTIKGKLNTIIDTLNEINAKVDTINNKVDEIASSIAEALAEIKSEFSELKIRDDLTAIRSFDKTIFEDYQDKLDVAINKQFFSFSNYSTYKYQETYKIDQAYVLQIGNMTGEYISILGSDIKEAIEESSPYDIDYQKEWLKEVAQKILTKYIENPDFVNLLNKRRSYGFTDDTFLDSLANGLYVYLRNEFKTTVFQGGELADYVANLITDFKEYCRKLSDPLDSPLLRQYDILQNTFCFQKDTYYLDSEGERRNIGVDIGYAYLLNLVRFANFTFEVSQISQSVTSEKISEISEDLLNTVKHLISLMRGFYKVDEEGHPYDNYCYATKCPVVVGNNNLSSSKENFITVEIRDNKIDLEGDESGYAIGDLVIKEDQINKIRLDENQIAYLSVMSNKMPSLIEGTHFSFKEHLDDVFNEEFDNIYLSSGQASNFDLSDGYLMNSYAFAQNKNNDVYHNAPDELIDKNQIYVNKTGYNNVDALQDKYFNYHQEIRGDYFDLNSGKVMKDESLYSSAMYYEPNTNYDDIGFFSSSKVMGVDNEATVNTTDLWGGEKNAVPFYDSVATMKIETQQKMSGGEKISKYAIEYDYNFKSLNLLTNVKYGQLKLNNSPFEVGFSSEDYQNLNEAIDRANSLLGLTGDNKIPVYNKNSNDSPYWIGYDLSATSEEAAMYKQYLYDRFINPGKESNLVETYNYYKNFSNAANDAYRDVIDKPYKGKPYVKIDLNEIELEASVNTVLTGIKVMEELGLDTKGFIMPSEDATDFTLLAALKPQTSRRLYIDEYFDAVYAPHKDGFIVMPVLAYTENEEEKFFELPSMLSQLLQTNDVELNIPVFPYEDDLATKFYYDTNIAIYGLNQSTLIGDVNTKYSTQYVTFKVPAFGAYSINTYLDVAPGKFTVVEGKNPTCVESGYRDALIDQDGNYYANASTLIGDFNAYDEWRTTGAGKIDATGIHNYVVEKSHIFYDDSKEFDVTLKCSECDATKEHIIADGVFVSDEPATCEHPEIGHYAGLCSGSGNTKILVKTESIYEKGSILPHPTPLVHIEGVPASCDREGIYEHYICPECGARFEDADGLYPFSGSVVIDAINHTNKEHHDANEATEFAPGNKEYWYCPDCGQYFLDSACTQKVTYQQVVIPQITYSYVRVNQLLPTHYTNGHKTYYYSLKDGEPDGRYYLDEQGVEEIIDFESWISEGGDGFIAKEPCCFDGPVHYIMNGDKCTASTLCTYPGCKIIKQETVTAVFVIDTPATPTSLAKGHYEATFIDPYFDVYVTPTNSVIDPSVDHIHHYSILPTYSWNGDKCTATVVCTHEGCDEMIQETVTAIFVTDIEATCSSNAKGHYEATFTNILLGKTSTPYGSSEVINSKLEHEYDVTYAWADGVCIATAKCDLCDHTVNEIVKGTFITDTPATCVSNTKGHYKAVFTNSLFATQETPANSVVIPNSYTPHEYGNPTYTWNEDKCIAKMICTHDGCTSEVAEIGFASIVIDTPASTSSNAKGHYEVIFSNSAFTKQTTEPNSIEIPNTKLQSSGCGGSIIAGSAVICALSLAGVGLILLRKKKEDK